MGNIAGVEDPIARLELQKLRREMKIQQNFSLGVIQNIVSIIGKATGARIVYQVSAPDKSATMPDIWVKSVPPYKVYHKGRDSAGNWEWQWTTEFA